MGDVRAHLLLFLTAFRVFATKRVDWVHCQRASASDHARQLVILDGVDRIIFMENSVSGSTAFVDLDQRRLQTHTKDTYNRHKPPYAKNM